VYEGCDTTVVSFLARNSRFNNYTCAGALSW
jgi:hypothetical protein